MKRVKRARKRSGKRGRAAGPVPNPAKQSSPATQAAEEYFVKSLLVRGEAVASEDGSLPPGATHEIVEDKKEGLPTVKRRRFSLA